MDDEARKAITALEGRIIALEAQVKQRQEYWDAYCGNFGKQYTDFFKRLNGN